MAKDKIDLVTILLLLAILVSAAVLTYYPHINYPFPLHVDEYFHISMAQAIAKTGSISHPDPYFANVFDTSDIEGGYHALLALLIVLFHPSITDWTYIPAILEVIACLCVFVFVDRFLGRKEALIATLLVALLPSSVNFGGPVFLIPENLGLILIPIALVFAFRLTKLKAMYSYAILFVISAFLLYSHPPTALVLLLILFFYAVMLMLSGERDSRRHAMYVSLVILLSVVVSVPNYLSYLHSNGLGSSLSFGSQLLAQPILLAYGLVQTILFVVGFYVLFRKRTSEISSILLASVALFVLVFLFANFGISLGIPYQRTYIPLFLLMSIVASSGYVSLLGFDKKKGLKLGSIILACALVATLYLSIHEDLSTPYYHLITQQDYSNFLYIKAHYSSNSIAIMNPYTARAFTPITGMHVYIVEPFGPSAVYSVLLNNTSSFFSENCSNTNFLRENNISIVYTNETCTNGNLTKVTNDTYVLKNN